MTTSSTAMGETLAGKAGAWLSLACAVHCAVEPVVLPLLPLVGIALPINERVEHVLIGASITLALWNFSRGFRVHGRAVLFLVLLLALAFIGLGLAVGHAFENHAWEAGFVVLGTLTLARANFGTATCTRIAPSVAMVTSIDFQTRD